MSDLTPPNQPRRKSAAPQPQPDLPPEFGFLPENMAQPPMSFEGPPLPDAADSEMPPPSAPRPGADGREETSGHGSVRTLDDALALDDTVTRDGTVTGDDADQDQPPAPSADGRAPSEPPLWGSGPGWEARPEWGTGPSWGANPDLDLEPEPEWDEGLDDPPPFTRERRRLWPWFLALFILITPFGLMGACTAFLVSRSRAPIDATNEFIAALDEQRIDDAYDQLCQPTKDAIPFAAFAADYSRSGEITDYVFSSISAPSNRMTLVSGKIDLAGAPWATAFHVRQEGEEWQVCQYEALPSEDINAPAP